MSHELHYTSVPRGLKAGSVGFCTVAQTANLPAPVADRLEGLSGYRPAFAIGSPSSDLNPVVYSHLKLSIGTLSYSILSRVAPSGLDYTQRGNVYAHHVAIEPAERPAGGPAWLAARMGFLDSSWTGEPRTLGAGRKIPQGDHPPGICQAWAARFGDAGWAGVLVESFLNDSKKPVYLIYDAGQDVLPLFLEAVSLLPPEKRWDVSFSTYYTGQTQGMICLWRAVPRDSAEAVQAKKLPNVLILDPAALPGEAKGGALVTQARTGIAPKPTIPASKPRAAGATAQPTLRPPARKNPVAEPPDRYDLDDDPFDEPASPARSLPPSPAASVARPRSKKPTKEQLRNQLFMKAWIGGALVLILGLIGGTLFSLAKSRAPDAASGRPVGAESKNPVTQSQADDTPPEQLKGIDESNYKVSLKEKPPDPKPVPPPVPNGSGKRLVEAPKVATPTPNGQPKTVPTPPTPATPPEPPRPEPSNLIAFGALPDLVKDGESPQLSLSQKFFVPVSKIEVLGAGAGDISKELSFKTGPMSESRASPIVFGTDTGSFSEVGTIAFKGVEVRLETPGKLDSSSGKALLALRKCLLEVTLANNSLHYLVFQPELKLSPIGLSSKDCLKNSGLNFRPFEVEKPLSNGFRMSLKEVRLQADEESRPPVATRVEYSEKNKETRDAKVTADLGAKVGKVEFQVSSLDGFQLLFKFTPAPQALWGQRNAVPTKESVEVALRKLTEQLANLKQQNVQLEDLHLKQQQEAQIQSVIDNRKRILTIMEFTEKYKIAYTLQLNVDGRTILINSD